MSRVNLSFEYPIIEPSQIGDARRRILDLANASRYSEIFRGNLAIIINELAGNLIKHTSKGGIIIARALQMGEDFGIEILSVDHGPGMLNPEQCMRDGFSTARSPGTGLGAVVRLSNIFDLHSNLEKGTVIVSQLWMGNFKLGNRHSVGAICVPISGETVSGDAWEVHESGERVTAVMVDGLGHGPGARLAAETALRVFNANQNSSPSEILKITHLAMKSSRGAAVAFARINLETLQVEYCGVGNTVGLIQTSTGTRRMVSHNGTAGVQTSRVQEFIYTWEADAALILHSDGISTHWSLEKYPGLMLRHPSVIAGVIYRDFKRGKDDAAIFVFKKYDGKDSR
jgi:anti-sigma regulatory factor (Ser/Thr protein kinase)